jgi:hypothetical protein
MSEEKFTHYVMFSEGETYIDLLDNLIKQIEDVLLDALDTNGLSEADGADLIAKYKEFILEVDRRKRK